MYKNFLDGRRGNTSVYGIFPKTVPRGAALKAEEERKTKEKEDERKKKAAEEELKRQQEEKLTKKLVAREGAPTGQQKSEKQMREEQKRKEREEEIRREKEKKEAEEAKKKEESAIKEEAKRIRTIFDKIKAKAGRGEVEIRKWFNLFDKNKDSRLDKNELSEIMKHAGVYVNENDLNLVMKVLDLDKSGIVMGQEFVEVMSGKKVPDYEQYVRANFAKAKKEEEDAKRNDTLKAYAKVKSKAGTQDSMSDPYARDKKLPSDNMSSIMDMPGGGKRGGEKARLMDNEEDIKRCTLEIKSLLKANMNQGKPATLDDLFAFMGKPKFQKEDKILLVDFEKLVRARGGSSAKFTAHEIK